VHDVRHKDTGVKKKPVRLLYGGGGGGGGSSSSISSSNNNNGSSSSNSAFRSQVTPGDPIGLG
jgi:hypothetical protein